MDYKLFIKKNKIKINLIEDEDIKSKIEKLISSYETIEQNLASLEDDDEYENAVQIKAYKDDLEEISNEIIEILETELDDELSDDIDISEKLEKLYNSGTRKITRSQLDYLGLEFKNMPKIAGASLKFGSYKIMMDYYYSTNWSLTKI